jgi:hypothetical protein
MIFAGLFSFFGDEGVAFSLLLHFLSERFAGERAFYSGEPLTLWSLKVVLSSATCGTSSFGSMITLMEKCLASSSEVVAFCGSASKEGPQGNRFRNALLCFFESDSEEGTLVW